MRGVRKKGKGGARTTKAKRDSEVWCGEWFKVARSC